VKRIEKDLGLWDNSQNYSSL